MDDLRPLSTDILNAALAGVDRGVFGLSLVYQSQVGSTNDYLHSLASQGAPEGTVVIADEQTEGRGRLGRAWVAPPNTSLLFTTLFRPSLHPEYAHQLVMVAGLAIAEACEEMTGVTVDVKWPNDLQIGGKKFVGILLESSVMADQIEWLIVGTGINVNHRFEPADPLAETATSLRVACGQTIDRASLFALILRNYYHWHSRLGEDQLISAWRLRCITLGRRVSVQSQTGLVTGLAHNIGSSGVLHIKDDSGNVHFIHASEATIIHD